MEPMTMLAVASAAKEALPKISQMLGTQNNQPLIWTRQGVLQPGLFQSGQPVQTPTGGLDISSILKMIPGGQK